MTRFMTRPPRRALLVAGLVSLAAAAGGAWWATTSPARSIGGIGGPFALIDGQGKAVTDRDLRGRFALIYFGYTFCPDVCPTTLSSMIGGLDALGADADRVRPVFITIDPERDTPNVVRAYVAAFSPRLLGLTGSVDAVAAAAKAFRVYFAKHPNVEKPADYTLDHSSILYLMDEQGGFRALIRADQTPSETAAEIRRNL